MAFALASAVNSAGTASVTRKRHRSSKTTVTEAPNPCTQSGEHYERPIGVARIAAVLACNRGAYRKGAETMKFSPRSRVQWPAAYYYTGKALETVKFSLYVLGVSAVK
jgi:hypothetical protein